MLSVCVHIVGRTLGHHSFERFKSALVLKLTRSGLTPTSPMSRKNLETTFEMRCVEVDKGTIGSTPTSRLKTKKSVTKILDIVLQLFQLATFVATFRCVSY